MENPKSGDLVCLKSEPRLIMTVGFVTSEMDIECFYHNHVSGLIETVHLPVSVLQPASL